MPFRPDRNIAPNVSCTPMKTNQNEIRPRNSFEVSTRNLREPERQRGDCTEEHGTHEDVVEVRRHEHRAVQLLVQRNVGQVDAGDARR